MIVRVLDCSGSTMAGANSVSLLLDDRILLDAGAAASALTLEEQVGITDVFLTHAHLDHVKSLPFIAENVLGRRDGPIAVRATEDTIEKLSRHVLNGEIWPDFTRIPDEERPVLEYASLTAGEAARVAGLEFVAIPTNHPGGSVGFLIRGETGTLAFTGDTGPTEAFWREVRDRGDEVKVVIVETSFPDRLSDLAERSGHLTPRTLAGELSKLGDSPAAVYVYGEKAPTRDETRAEIEALPDVTVAYLEPGLTLAV